MQVKIEAEKRRRNPLPLLNVWFDGADQNQSSKTIDCLRWLQNVFDITYSTNKIQTPRTLRNHRSDVLIITKYLKPAECNYETLCNHFSVHMYILADTFRSEDWFAWTDHTRISAEQWTVRKRGKMGKMNKLGEKPDRSKTPINRT